MNFSKNATLIRRILILLSFLIVTSILWNTYIFFQKFKEEERVKMRTIAEALKTISNTNSNSATLNLAIEILNSNKSIPFIRTNKNGKIMDYNNLDSLKALDSLYLKKQLLVMKNTNKPIVLSYLVQDNLKNTSQEKKMYLYYRDSSLLTKLKYYPLALLLILVLFVIIIYLVYKSIKSAEQNKLWAGMAKETAHQIGTPLSSLLGWIELLKMENTDPAITQEIEKDVHRLNAIAERFSKIGSLPNLEKINLIPEIKRSFDYLKSRSSKQVNFDFISDESELFILGNKQLLGWVIENILKNAIDAMHGKGKLILTIFKQNNKAVIRICDNGKGLNKKQFKQIFETGYTTKKRGWGLGLSLAKRIIEDYHKGKVFVQSSTIKKGTCIEINLDLISKN
ncbi:MAG TPA: GHKL domain-containing protein [Flavobacteriia bacterium]|nr:GHKL domain-containing protein [Flavobacteriia bacterium]